MERGRMEGKGSLGGKDYSAFVFDLDGTLFSIPVDWGAVRREVGAAAGEAVGGRPLFSFLEELGRKNPERQARTFSIVESYEMTASAASKPMDGAAGLVERLSRASRVALVTMQGRRPCRSVLERHGMLGLFAATVTREDSLDRSIQLRIVLERMRTSHRDALFIGDRLNDVVCARRQQVDVALVGREASGPVKPDYSFPGLLALGKSLRLS